MTTTTTTMTTMTKKHRLILPLAAVAMFASASVSNAAVTSYSFTATNDATAGIFTSSFDFDSSAATPLDIGGGEFQYGGTASSPGQPSPTVLPTIELNNPDYPTAVWNLDDDYWFINIVTDAAGNPLRLNWDGDNVEEGGFMGGTMDFVGGTGAVEQDAGPIVHVGSFHEDPYSGVVLVPEPGSLALLGLSGLALLRRRR